MSLCLVTFLSAEPAHSMCSRRASWSEILFPCLHHLNGGMIIFVLQKGSGRCSKLPLSLSWSQDLSLDHSETNPLPPVIWMEGPRPPCLLMAGRNWIPEMRKLPAESHPATHLPWFFSSLFLFRMFPKPVNQAGIRWGCLLSQGSNPGRQKRGGRGHSGLS